MSGKKPKPDMLDRQIKALGKLGRTKSGRDFIKDHREAILGCLVEGVGKP